MNEQEILEGNKLIAEFMGFVKDGFLWKHRDVKLSKYYPKNIFEGDNTNSFKFHSSWDWLMPVVEKLECLENCRFQFEIYTGPRCFIYDNSHDLIEGDSDTKLQAVYESIVEFIKWYSAQESK